MQQKYEFKDAYMLLKAIAEKATEIYKDKNEMIVKQLEKSADKKYRCRYGLLSLRNNKAKTAKVYTAKEQKQVDELQAQIDELQAQIDKLGKEVVVKDAYNSLVCNNNAIAENEATELLEILIRSIGNASMTKAASKVARQ